MPAAAPPAAEDVQRLSATVGTDELTAARALAAAGGDFALAMSQLMAQALPEDRALIEHYSEKTATLSESLLSWEETYTFDTLGFCVLPGKVSSATLAQLSAAVRGSGEAQGGTEAQVIQQLVV